MKVSFIGLGRMGQIMAGRLLEAHADLMVYNRTADKAAELAGRGAQVAADVAQACRHGGPVITMLADDAALRAVTQGAGGILESLPAGGVHVVMGTHEIATIRELTAAHRAAGLWLVAAPVIGRPVLAAAGKLRILAAGPPARVRQVRPLLRAIGRRIFVVGKEPENASLLKLCNNVVLACAIEAMGETFTLVEKSGIDARAFQRVLNGGLFKCLAYDGYAKAIVGHSWDAANFSARLALKDLNCALEVADAQQVPLPSARVCRERLLSAEARGEGQRDWTVMALEQARASGLEWD